MNRNKRNFWLDIVLLVLFVLTVGALFVDGQIWTRIHYIAGMLMLLGAVIHLVWHWHWIKAKVLHYPKNVNKETHANRRINIALFIFFFLCGVSGLIVWLMEIANLGRLILSFSDWSHLHGLTGMLMFLMMIPHLGYHRKWLVCMARKSLSPIPRQPLKPSMGKSEF